MSVPQNCWEFKKCGREPGGVKVDELGVCPAATATESDGTNQGKNGGRVCWALAGTYCGGKTQGSYADKQETCLMCDFMRDVRKVEGVGFSLFPSVGAGAASSFFKTASR